MNRRPVAAPGVRLGSGVHKRRRSASLLAAAGTLAGLMVVGSLAGTAVAQDAKEKGDAAKVKADESETTLEGAWSGGGRVTFAMTGSSERARCRAHYRRRTKDTYAVQATCATPSGRAAQTATLHRVGENRYRGSFHNAEYDISGTMFVVVNGNSQSVRLTSSSGSASLKLSR